MTTFSDGVKIGATKGRKRGPSVRSSLAILDFVPATLDRDGICASQTRTGAGDLVINGALAANGVAILDSGVESFGRCVGIYSSGNLSAVTFTVYGHTVRGAPLRAAIAGPNNSTVTIPKAFRRVTRVTTSATIGTAAEVGTVDRFGLPMRLYAFSQVVRAGFGATLAEDAATFVIGDGTSPATASTTDVRGTVVPSAAADGSKRLTVVMVPTMTDRASQYGVEDYGLGV